VPDLLIKNGQFNENSLTKVKGFAEPSILNINSGEIVQFERFGFVRIEKDHDQIHAFFTHR
jgi:hypothetical protein